jgi:Cu-Zn family superoxide dismutase
VEVRSLHFKLEGKKMKNIACKIWLAFSLLAAGCGGAQSADESTASDQSTKKKTESVEVKILSATAILSPVGRNVATGLVYFKDDNGKMRVSAEFHGLFPGKYNFHISESDKCGSKSVEPVVDGGPNQNDNDEVVEGDRRVIANLGFLDADENRSALAEFEKENLSFTGAESIVDRTVVVCAGEEGSTKGSGGDACERIACGVIHSD